MKVFASLLCFLFWNSLVFGQDTVFINKDFLSQLFGKKLLVTTTKIDSFDINISYQWQTSLYDNFKVKTKVFNWIKINAQNLCDYDRTLLLFLQNVQIERAKLFVVNNGRIVYKSEETGCILPVSKRATSYRTMALPLLLPKSSVSTIYAMIYRKDFGLTIRPTLVDPIKGIDFYWTDYCFYAVVSSSILLILTSFLFNYFVSIKKVKFEEILWFQIYLIISLCYVISASGIGAMHIWGKFPWFEVNASIFFGALSGAAFLFFCNRALQVVKISASLSKIFDGISIFYLCSTLPGFLMYSDEFPSKIFTLLISISYLLILVCLLIVMGIGAYKAIWQRKKVYYWFLCIFVFLVSYTVISLGLELGILTYDFRFHALRILLAYFPQLIITLTFLILLFLGRLKNMEFLMREFRKEITHDIHDEIGSELTKISLTAHLISVKNPSLKDKLDLIKNESISANKKLKDLIFAINPTFDKLRDIMVYLKDLFSKSEMPNLNLDLEMDIIKENILIQPNIKSQMIKIIDEALDILKEFDIKTIVKLETKNNEALKIQFRLNGLPIEYMENTIAKFQRIVKSLGQNQEAIISFEKNEDLLINIELLFSS